MAIQFQPTRRKKPKTRLLIKVPTGNLQAYNGLLNFIGSLGCRIAVIQTEGSDHLGEYDVCTLAPPFTQEKYTEAVKAAEVAGYDVVIMEIPGHPGQEDLFGAVGAQAPPAENPDPARPEAVNTVAATQVQIRKIQAMIYELRMSDEELAKIIRQVSGKESEQELTKLEASLVIDRLNALPPDFWQAPSDNKKRLF